MVIVDKSLGRNPGELVNSTVEHTQCATSAQSIQNLPISLTSQIDKKIPSEILLNGRECVKGSRRGSLIILEL